MLSPGEELHTPLLVHTEFQFSRVAPYLNRTVKTGLKSLKTEHCTYEGLICDVPDLLFFMGCDN